MAIPDAMEKVAGAGTSLPSLDSKWIINVCYAEKILDLTVFHEQSLSSPAHECSGEANQWVAEG
jgi:hypothetical protein